jgi:hypothetical protein
MKNTDNNKLIAEFMGANPFRESVNEDVLSYEMYGVLECIEDGISEKHFFLPEEMQFHTSWDWLMPVIEKIEDEEDCEFRITDDWSDKKTFTCSISARRDGEVIVRGSQASDNKLKAYYLAIVKFITC